MPYIVIATIVWIGVVCGTIAAGFWWAVALELLISVAVYVIVLIAKASGKRRALAEAEVEQQREYRKRWGRLQHDEYWVSDVKFAEWLTSLPKPEPFQIVLSPEEALEMDTIIKKLDERFLSGNSVPIENAKLTAKEWEKIKLWLQKSQIWVFNTSRNSDQETTS